jgi:hypothetical protein
MSRRSNEREDHEQVTGLIANDADQISMRCPVVLTRELPRAKR